MLQHCELVGLPRVDDDRGSLSFLESGKHVPFAIKRIFYLYEIAKGAPRGDHAHKLAKQFFIALHGSFDILLDDGVDKKKLTLSTPAVGLFVPSLVWAQLNNFSSDAVCLVLTDQFYDAADYIRDYNEFCNMAKGKK